MDDTIWYFDDTNLYDIFCPHKMGEYEKTHQFKHYKKGDVIYFNDDTAHNIYLIAGGKVRILNYTEEGDEVVKNVLSRGELFGELALLGERKRMDIAEAMDDDTSICPLNIDLLHELMKDNRELSFKVYRFIGLRLKRLERRLDALVFKDVRARLIEFIKDLAEEKGVKEGERTIVTHYLTHKNIGNLIGTSRQTVTTLLNELKEQGLIDFNRKQFHIPNVNQLK